MQYFLQEDHNTGNWWLVEQEDDGYRRVVQTLSHKLNYLEARQHLNKYIKEKQDEE